MKPKYLTLEEIEQCANNIVKDTDLDCSIRDKFRYLSTPLIARYSYYVISREQMKTVYHKAHSLKDIGSRIGFNHSTVLNGINSLQSLIVANKENAPKIFEAVKQECNKLLKKKYESEELNKECKSLLIGFYAA